LENFSDDHGGFMKFSLKTFRSIAFAITFAATSMGCAATHSALGLWQTFDHKLNVPSSVIKIWESNGKYFGKIAKIYPVNGAKKTDLCVKCKGKQYNQPMMGLLILRDMVAKGDEFVGGTILDPRDGKEYRCKFKLSHKGEYLDVRGYIGFSFFGKTDVWKRIAKI
jgi:uncharacterized protein (DUF2147 family)